ncbi:MAG: haloacid dehalogenase type II [Rhizobiales bacterium]|nr:haloacid dehalogenase type II [Hyphomicrobiales bacterium]
MFDPAPIRALAFDYYGTIGDKHGLGAAIDRLVPGGKGAALAKLWFLTCQRYCFQMGMMERYRPWNELTRSALDYAAADLGVILDDAVRDELLEADRKVPVYPEAPAALARLAARFSLHVLSMGAPSMIEASQERAGIRKHFTSILTTEPDRVYKPGKAAYSVGVRGIGHPAEAIGFVSGNSFDVIGASNFGFPSFWVRRYGQPLDALGPEPDLVVADLAALADALGA